MEVSLAFRFFFVLAFMGIPSYAFADQVRYLKNAPEFLSAVYQSIQSAQNGVDLISYEINPCDSSFKVIAKALAAKKTANPKFRVRIIADDYEFPSESMRSALATTLAQQKIDFKIFNSAGYFRTPTYNFRSHAKYVVVDGDLVESTLITGSSNWTDNYFGLKAGSKVNYINRDVMVEGTSGSVAYRHFNSLWSSSWTSVRASKVSSLDEQKACLAWNAQDQALEDFLKTQSRQLLQESYQDTCTTAFAGDELGSSSNGFDWSNVTATNTWDKEMQLWKDRQLRTKATLKAISRLLDSKGATSVLIENYLYMPFGKIDEFLANLRKQNRPILVYTNFFYNSGEKFEDYHDGMCKRDSQGSEQILSLATADRADAHWALSPKNLNFQIHSKVFVTPEGAFVGSYNIDPRSYLMNIESGVLLKQCQGRMFEHMLDVTQQLTDHLSDPEKASLTQRMQGQFPKSLQSPSEWALWQFGLTFL